MEKDNFCKVVSEAMHVEEISGKTLDYRINGFLHACYMDIDLGKGVKIINNGNCITGILKKKNGDVLDYFITVRKIDEGNNKYVAISGEYEELGFSFTNCYQNDSINKKIVDIPFCIILVQSLGRDTYQLKIETVNGVETRFTIGKHQEYKNNNLFSKATYYANILDFSKVLKIVKLFVYNPKLLLNAYDEIMETKKIVLNNKELGKMLMDDEKLEEPVGKIRKKVKILTNSD